MNKKIFDGKELTKEEKEEIITELKNSYKYYNFLQRMVKKIKGEVPDWKKIENYTDDQLKYLIAARKCETYIQFLHRRLASRNMDWYFGILENEAELNFSLKEEEKIRKEPRSR